MARGSRAGGNLDVRKGGRGGRDSGGGGGGGWGGWIVSRVEKRKLEISLWACAFSLVYAITKLRLVVWAFWAFLLS